MSSKNVCVHFKCKGCIYNLMFKMEVENITLSMVEGRIYKKVGLDKNKVKLRLSFMPLVKEKEGESVITDDEDLGVWLESTDLENRRGMLYVEVITLPVPSVEESRAEKSSSFGNNYVVLDDEKLEEIGPNAITLYVEKEQSKEDDTAMEADDCTREADDCTREADDCTREGYQFEENRGDEYVEVPPVLAASQYIDEWEDGLNVKLKQEFRNKKALLEVVDKGAFKKSFGFRTMKSDTRRLVLICDKDHCTWRLRAAVIKNTEIFSIRRYNKMHTCSRASESSSSNRKRRKGTPQIVASILRDNFPGQMETPPPNIIMEIVKTNLGVQVSYSTALRGKKQVVSDLLGNPEESYKLMYCYLHVLERENVGTKTCVKLDDETGKFKYLFFALGASIEGFKHMRKVLIVDASFIKNGYPAVLVAASAQDPNTHIYPIGVGVLDGENMASWHWFFEMLKTVVPDSTELVFMSDRNQSLISAIGNVYPQAHHAYCVRHMSQNVKAYAANVNKDVVAWKFTQLSKKYTEAEFKTEFEEFKTRYPSAGKYVEDTADKEHWARYCFPGEKYDILTSNIAESLNNTFEKARSYSLIPLLDTVIKKISQWFNEHRKESVAGTSKHKLVLLVENKMHDWWALAEKLKVTELHHFHLEYNVIDIDGKSYSVNLSTKSCSCRFFDIERYPCLHGLAAFTFFLELPNKPREIQLHELCSRYYWTESWAMAYCRTIYLVPDKSQWNVPDDIKELQIIPPDKKKKKGRRKVKRFPSVGESRQRRTQTKRRPRQGLPWWLLGEENAV